MSTTSTLDKESAPPPPPSAREPSEFLRRAVTRIAPGPGALAQAWLTILALAVALLLSTILVAATGGSPSAVAVALFEGSMSDAASWSQTLLAAAPLLIVAVGACVGNRAGAFNIGQEGQVLIGALMAMFIGLRMSGPPILVITVSIVVGAIFGGLWAGVSSLLHRLRGVNIVVSTLLMSFIAVQVVSYMVSVPWLLQEPKTDASSTGANQSALLPQDYRLPSVGQYPDLSVNVGLIIGVVLTVIIAVVLARSRWGFTMGIVGLNPLTAQHAGVRVALAGAVALMISGACAGLAGAVVVESSVFRLQPAVANNIGWDGMLIALIARNRPMVAIPVAIVFGALRTGSAFLSATGVPIYLVNVVQSLLVLACVIAPALSFASSQLSKKAQQVS